MSTPPKTPRRLWFAYLLAPLATVPTMSTLGYFVVRASRPEMSHGEVVDSVAFSSFFVALFGLPIAYLVQALLIGAVRWAGKDPMRVRGSTVIPLTTAVGGASFGAINGLDASATFAGAAMGLSASVVFVLVRGPARESATGAS